jgi:predicted HNH restriction endonuclease
MKDERLPWRCKNKKQAKDKMEIYNSREWHEVRAAKLRANPLCEMCIEEGQKKGIKRGYIREARLVHHVHPIEESNSKEEMKHWAFLWGNLQSLCRECHARIHNQKGYHKKENVKARRNEAFERWKSRLKGHPPADPT